MQNNKKNENSCCSGWIKSLTACFGNEPSDNEQPLLVENEDDDEEVGCGDCLNHWLSCLRPQ